MQRRWERGPQELVRPRYRELAKQRQTGRVEELTRLVEVEEEEEPRLQIAEVALVVLGLYIRVVEVQQRLLTGLGVY